MRLFAHPYWRAGQLRSRCWLLLFAFVVVLPVFSRAANAQDTPPPPPPPEVEAPDTPAPPDGATPTTAPAPVPQTQSGRYLLLPDISLIGTFLGHLSTDKRDDTRDKLRLDEAEMAIQSYVYPSIKADAFIVFAGDGGVVVEEAYLTAQNVPFLHLPLSAQVGRRKVPFGRVNQLHPHSWLYIVQPYVLSNLVSGESLNGDGGYLSYLLPTGKLFAQLDAGLWSLSESPEDIDPQQDPTQGIISSPGAGFADKFATVRLWTAAEVLGGSVELGGSLARGRGASYTPVGYAGDVSPTTQISGLDFSYRRAGAGASRLLLRGEYIHHRQKDSGENFSRSADGYYLFADQRFGPYTSLAARYDQSGFPFAEGRERAVSLIGTHQLTEQTYFRLQLIRGDRPGKKNFNEIYFQWVWGVGPHTHTLE